MQITSSRIALSGGDALWHYYSLGDVRYNADCPAALHFSAANGFPVRTYDFFLSQLAQSRDIIGLDNRGAWLNQSGPQAGFTWNEYVDDLIEFLEHSGVSAARPIIGVGHSLGASVTLMAATRKPELFSRLVLIDPACRPVAVDAQIATQDNYPYPKSLVQKLTESTRNRRNNWVTPEQFRDFLNSRDVYRSFSASAIDNYVSAGLSKEAEDRYVLRFKPQWEAHNFQKTPNIWPFLSIVTVPTLFLYGEDSFLYPPAKMTIIHDQLSSCVDVKPVVDAGHLAVQERPEQILELISQWLPA